MRPLLPPPRVTLEPVLTDNGKCFKRRSRDGCAELAIKAKRTRPYRPQTNGKVERFIRTLLEVWAYSYPYRNERERAAVVNPALDAYNRFRRHRARRANTATTRQQPPRDKQLAIVDNHISDLCIKTVARRPPRPGTDLLPSEAPHSSVSRESSDDHVERTFALDQAAAMNAHLLMITFRVWLVELPLAALNYFVLMRHVYAPRVGEVRAHQIGMSTRIVYIFAIAYFLVRVGHADSAADYLVAGTGCCCGWRSSRSAASSHGPRVHEILEGWHVENGYVWPYVLIAYLLSPLIIGLSP